MVLILDNDMFGAYNTLEVTVNFKAEKNAKLGISLGVQSVSVVVQPVNNRF